MRGNDPCTTTSSSSSSSSSCSGSSTSRLHVNGTRQMVALHRLYWFALCHSNTMQYYTLQSNAMQCSDTTQHNATQGFTIQPNTTQCHHILESQAMFYTMVLPGLFMPPPRPVYTIQFTIHLGPHMIQWGAHRDSIS